MVMPHNIIQKVNEVMEVYDQLQKGLAQYTPATIAHDLKSLHQFVNEVEREYGGMEQFVYEIATLKKQVEALTPSD